MKNACVLALVLACAPVAAAAQDIGYTYLEGGYARVNVDVDDAGSSDFDGAQVRGSIQLGVSDVYLFGGYGLARNDESGVDVDFSEAQAGVGYRFEVGDTVDLLGELSALRQEVDADGVGGADASGGRLSIGVRAMLGDNVEGYAKASYNGGGDFDGSVSATLGAQLKFGEMWGVVGEVEAGQLSDEVDVAKFLLALRATF